MNDPWALVRELEIDIDVMAGLCIADRSNVSLRRAYIRTVFSALDGTLYDLRQDIIQSSGFGSLFSVKERGKLLERRVKGGVVTSYTQYLKLEDSIPFTMKCFARHMGINNFNFPHNSEGWEKMKSSISLRHRITHPKKVNDLHISIQEFENIVTAKVWFKEDVSQQFV